MSLLTLVTHTVTIKRNTEPLTRDVGDPAIISTVIASNVPCRFDKRSGQTLASAMQEIKVVGRIFIDSSAKDISGAKLVINESDILEIGGRSYTIYSLDEVFSHNYFHHYEIDVVNYQNP